MSKEVFFSSVCYDEFRNDIKEIFLNEAKNLINGLTPPANDTPELLTRKETAKNLGISLVTLNEWTKTGVIPAKRIGGSVRYEKHAVVDSLKDIETIKYRRA